MIPGLPGWLSVGPPSFGPIGASWRLWQEGLTAMMQRPQLSRRGPSTAENSPVRPHATDASMLAAMKVVQMRQQLDEFDLINAYQQEWRRLLGCGIYWTRRKPSASFSRCCPTTSVWCLTTTKNLLAVHYCNAGNPSSACFQLHTAAGTGTVRCTISEQTTQQQAQYGALSADRRHSSRH
jgi:hypothetical protein